jgi:hypothetical protein
MNYLLHTLHPALFFDHKKRTGTAWGLDFFHLNPGSLDKVRGPYCVWMAMVILGYISEEIVVGLHYSLRSHFQTVWYQTAAPFIDGTEEQNMQKLLGSLSEFITYSKASGKSSNLLEFVSDRVHRAQLVLVVFQEKQTPSKRWALVVGLEGRWNDKTSRFSDLVCLDPDEDAQPLIPFNARMERYSSRPTCRTFRYLTASGEVMRIELTCAFALMPLPRRKKGSISTIK